MNFFQRVLTAAAITLVIIILSFQESSDPVYQLLHRSEIKLESEVSILDKCDFSSSYSTDDQAQICLGNNEF